MGDLGSMKRLLPSRRVDRDPAGLQSTGREAECGGGWKGGELGWPAWSSRNLSCCSPGPREAPISTPFFNLLVGSFSLELNPKLESTPSVAALGQSEVNDLPILGPSSRRPRRRRRGHERPRDPKGKVEGSLASRRSRDTGLRASDRIGSDGPPTPRSQPGRSLSLATLHAPRRSETRGVLARQRARESA